MDLDLDFLKALLSAPGPSSFESRPAAVFRDRAAALGLATRQDAYGSVFAIAGEGRRPRLLLSGHIDEIGLIVTHVDEKGFAWFKAVGGWDAQQLVGQRVRVVGRDGDVVGLIGKKPIHLMSVEDRRKVSKIEDLWIDVGATDRDDALKAIEPGDVAVVEQPLVELRNGRIASKAIDDRIGAYVALEVARRSRDGGCEVIASATVQEEIGGVGAAAAAYGLEPDVAIAIDVTHATDVPGIEARKEGEHALGSGPELAVGSYVHRGVLELLRATADEEGIAVTIGTSPSRTATDADQLARARAGVPSAVVSVPNRYMHSPNEMVAPEDVEAVVRLLVAFARRLPDAHPIAQP
ncbi:MAG: M20/M25/M40 family metallo-hydrolase [Trueperaceae bacterium]|nr:M20/M25/M40 family metallo-hydrolase [Trueperaceae bacterium]